MNGLDERLKGSQKGIFTLLLAKACTASGIFGDPWHE
jgi:hypothetical protein